MIICMMYIIYIYNIYNNIYYNILIDGDLNTYIQYCDWFCFDFYNSVAWSITEIVIIANLFSAWKEIWS